MNRRNKPERELICDREPVLAILKEAGRALNKREVFDALVQRGLIAPDADVERVYQLLVSEERLEKRWLRLHGQGRFAAWDTKDALEYLQKAEIEETPAPEAFAGAPGIGFAGAADLFERETPDPDPVAPRSRSITEGPFIVPLPISLTISLQINTDGTVTTTPCQCGDDRSEQPAPAPRANWRLQQEIAINRLTVVKQDLSGTLEQSRRLRDEARAIRARY